jgi:acyl-CoA thioester hydrolase
MNVRFRYYLRVRYGECDAQKVVFNSRYSEYVDLAATEFLKALNYGEALINGDIDYQLVKQTVEWRKPARFDQVLELQVSASRLGTTSFTLQTDFRIAGSEDIIVTAETVYVLVNATSLQKMPLPSDLRASLQEGAAGKHVDHAGYRAGC